MKKTYLKIFSVITLLFTFFALVGCFSQDTTLEFVQFPKSVYLIEDESIDLKNVKIKINGSEYSLESAMKIGAVVTGYEFTEPGDYTLVIKYGNATISYSYHVGQVTPTPDYDVVWDGYGTEQYPYLISSKEELLGLSAVVNGKVDGMDNQDFNNKYYKLTNDINLTGVVWTPIGEGSRDDTTENATSFKGYFDGDNHKIIGLSDKGYYPAKPGEYKNSLGTLVRNGYVFGLFGIVDGATIKNIKMESVDIEGITIVIGTEVVVFNGDSVGAIAGYAIKNGGHSKFENCHVLSGSISSFDAIAGIVGRSYSSVSFYNCTNAANISVTLNAPSAKAAGITSIISLGNNVVFYNCSNSGRISGTSTNTAAIVANTQAVPFVMLGCSNTGDVYKGEEVYQTLVNKTNAWKLNLLANSTNSKGDLYKLINTDGGIKELSQNIYASLKLHSITIDDNGVITLPTTDFDWVTVNSVGQETPVTTISVAEITTLKAYVKIVTSE